jgi:hypothetical protein
MEGGDETSGSGAGAEGAGAPSALEGGAAGAVAMSAEESLSKGLEVQKFRLLSQIAHNKKVKQELEQKIKAAEAKALEKQKRLGEYNALFMKMGEAASEKAPGQKLGAREAVMGTKKIIDREIGKAAKECAVTEMQLNKTRARNAHLRVHVDALRKEHMTFKKLFVAMSEELAAVKSRIANTKRAIDEGYTARDRAQEEMTDIAKQFEIDKLERGQEWQLFSDAIEKANNEGMPDALEGGSGLLTQEEEEQLRKKIRKGQLKMAKDRSVLQMAEQKLAAFNEALAHIRTATGYEDLQDTVDLFNRYEDEKFNKVGAANRLVEEIERLEKDVNDMRAALKGRDASQALQKAQRYQALSTVEAAAASMDGAVLETSAAAAAVVAEVRSVLRVVEFAFHALGCDQVFEAAGMPGTVGGQLALTLRASGGAAAPSSPLKNKTASLKMYTSSVATHEEVRAGVTPATLTAFMGIIENRAADIIQQYVASAGASSAFASAAAAAAPPAVAPGQAAALGPSRPSGRLKESLTSSALVTALAMDASKLEAPLAPGVPSVAADDDLRPISMAELKRQAARQLDNDKNFKTLRASAAMASAAMTRN